MAKRRRRRRGGIRKIRWKSRDVKKFLITLAVVGLALFVISRVSNRPEEKKASTRSGVAKNVQKAVVPPALKPKKNPVSGFSKTPRVEPVIPAVRAPLPFPLPLPPARELRAGAPKIVFVIDDIGHTVEYFDDFRRLGSRITYAILPFLKYSAYFDRVSVETGAEVILHLPLESAKGTIPGPGLIRSTMSREYILDMLDRQLDLLPHRTGVNNHMGSKGTADPWLMELILNHLKKKNLIFLDSMTTGQSVARQIGSMIGLPILKRDVFLDNVDNLEAIREQVRLLAEIARQRGYAIGIGHYHSKTLRVLNEEIPRLEREGYQMVTLRDILKIRKN